MESRPLTKKDLHSIYKDVFDIGPQWYNLGLALGLLADELDGIKMLHRGSPSECLREMLKLWLTKSSIRSTRETLVEALCEKTLNAEDLADELKKKYISSYANQSHDHVQILSTVNPDHSTKDVSEKQNKSHSTGSLRTETCGSEKATQEVVVGGKTVVNISHGQQQVEETGQLPVITGVSSAKAAAMDNCPPFTNEISDEEKMDSYYTAYYDGVSYQFTSLVPEDLLCHHCHNLANKPQLTNCCRKLYCQTCITAAADCCQNPSDSSPDFRGEKQILNLDIKCPNWSSGCAWVGKLGGVASHCSQCQKELVLCSYKGAGCSAMVQRDQLEFHDESNWRKHMNLLLEKQVSMQKTIEQLQTEIKEQSSMQKAIKELQLKVEKQKSYIQKLRDEALLTLPNLRVTMRKITYLSADYWISDVFFHQGYLFQLVIRSLILGGNNNVCLTLIGSDFDEHVHWPCRGICTVKCESDSITFGALRFYDEDKEENVIRIKFLIEKPMNGKLQPQEVISTLVKQESLRWRMLSSQKLVALFSGVQESDSEFKIDIENVEIE